MPSAVQTSVLDVLKSAQNTGDGSLNVNATLSATNVTVTNTSGASAVNIQDGGNSITVDGSVSVGTALPAGANAIGKLAANDGVDVGDVTINNASGGSAVNIQDGGNSITVDGTVAVTNALETIASASLSSVSSSATTVSLLASNASRKGAYFFNESTQVLYLKFGTTASATSYTAQLSPNAFYEMPPRPIYTGAIDGIWAAANGAVRITEL